MGVEMFPKFSARALLVPLLFCIVGLGGCPDSDIQVDTVTAYNGFDHSVGYYPVGGEYSPAWHTQPHPVSFLVPRGGERVRLRFYLDGWAPRPYACTDPNRYDPHFLTIKLCPDAYPNADDNTGPDGPRWGYWGPMGGQNSPVARMEDAVRYVWQHWNNRVDWGEGITLMGHSYGGHGSIMLAMNASDSTIKETIAAVHAITPHTNVAAPGRRYDNDLAMRNAWGEFGRAPGDFVAAAERGDLSTIYWRFVGSPVDNLVDFNLDILDQCEQYRLACVVTYHGAGHAFEEPGVDLPTATFTDPNQTPSVVHPSVAFHQSSANHHGATRGHHNIGLSWHTARATSKPGRTVIPIRYKRFTNIGGGIPDQPVVADFAVTLREPRATAARKYAQPFTVGQWFSWQLGELSGTVEVATAGELDIYGLSLTSSEDYTNLELLPIPPPPIDQPTPDWKLVYTVQKHYDHPVPGTPIEQASNWTHTTDIGRINTTLARASVMLDDLKGNTELLHDCTAPTALCVAQEARVSPDGCQVAYSVGYGDHLVEARTREKAIPVGIMEIPYLISADLHVANLCTGKQSVVPLPPGIHRQPDWLSNTRLVFSSNAGNTWPFKNQFPFHADPARKVWPVTDATQEYGYGDWGKSMQIWAVDTDGGNLASLTPHENMALSPAVMTNGDILYSCWNAHGNKAHDSFQSVGPSTSKNKWWLCRMDGQGRDATVILNAHKTTNLPTRVFLDPKIITGGEGETVLRGIRSVAEIFPGRLAITNYYRNNHVGSMGIIFGMDYLHPHVEGCVTAGCNGTRPGTGRYVPTSLLALTPFGNDQDRYDNRRMADGRIGPKAGYPAPLPDTDTDYLITLGRGLNFDPALPEHATLAYTGGEPVAKRGIYRVKVPMVTNPFDPAQLEPIADPDQWQAFDARAIAPYDALYGRPAPTLPDLDPPGACYLQVVDATDSDLAPQGAYSWTKSLYTHCAHQACVLKAEDPDYFTAELAALTVYLPEMWDTTYRGADRPVFAGNANNMGHKSIRRYGSAPLLADGSVKMRVPCDTPLLMVGTDRKGRKVAHDEMLHSLRPGESRTCHGCHEGHASESLYAGVPAAPRFANTLAAATLPPLLTPDPVISCDTHVRPILERRCADCHPKIDRPYLCSDLAWDFRQLSGRFDTSDKAAPRHPGQKGVGQMARPYTSKWVSKFARESLLYWKCANQRTDGRSDNTDPDDIDFGADHPTNATEQECQTIARWIDEGIQR